MSWKNLNPWDWFKHEDDTKSDTNTIPVKRNDDLGNTTMINPMVQLHQDIDRVFNDNSICVG